MVKVEQQKLKLDAWYLSQNIIPIKNILKIHLYGDNSMLAINKINLKCC